MKARAIVVGERVGNRRVRDRALQDRRGVARSAALAHVSSPAKRIPAFDHLRVFVIALVILQHTAMAYCTGGQPATGGDFASGSAPVVDTAGAWVGFNLMVSWTNGFFMPLMFLLSGLFVRPSLARKGLSRYLDDRALRLGVPLLVGVCTVIPLAYYAAYLQSGGDIGFVRFWERMVTSSDQWPSGPLWFVAVLLVYDIVLALLLTRPAVRRLLRRLDKALDRRPPAAWFLAFVAVAALSYLPLRLVFGAALWATAGPFGVQVCRIGLYFFCFAAGALIGAERLARAFDRQWARWPLLAALATVPFFALDGKQPPEAVDGTIMVLFSSAMALGLLALFLKVGNRRSKVGDSLGANAYGIYLLHYPIVLWLQFALLGVAASVVVKGAFVLVAGFLLSWLASDLLRKVPGVARAV